MGRATEIFLEAIQTHWFRWVGNAKKSLSLQQGIIQPVYQRRDPSPLDQPEKLFGGQAAAYPKGRLFPRIQLPKCFIWVAIWLKIGKCHSWIQLLLFLVVLCILQPSATPVFLLPNQHKKLLQLRIFTLKSSTETSTRWPRVSRHSLTLFLAPGNDRHPYSRKKGPCNLLWIKLSGGLGRRKDPESRHPRSLVTCTHADEGTYSVYDDVPMNFCLHGVSPPVSCHGPRHTACARLVRNAAALHVSAVFPQHLPRHVVPPPSLAWTHAHLPRCSPESILSEWSSLLLLSKSNRQKASQEKRAAVLIPVF